MKIDRRRMVIYIPQPRYTADLHFVCDKQGVETDFSVARAVFGRLLYMRSDGRVKIRLCTSNFDLDMGNRGQSG